MNRRTFTLCGLAGTLASPLFAALQEERLDDAANVLASAVASGQVDAAVLHVRQSEFSWTRSFGKAKTGEAMFLLGSISKPIAMTALMTLFDQAAFKVDDPLSKFLPEFKGNGRHAVTIGHLLTHTSGLPDQVSDNESLRKNQASLSEFVEKAIHTPLQFAPGERYFYSSMGILLAARVAELISKQSILSLVESSVFQPLKMQHAAQGLGRFKLEEMIPVQTERAAPESGGGDPSAKDWDWNSLYWRKLGTPWGGAHVSAPDIGRFLDEFLQQKGTVVKPETARLMIRNHNQPGLAPRGLGFDVGKSAGGVGCSEKTFGHTGSTGTLCWADPLSQTICVVLTSLPARAVEPHPRDLAAKSVAAACR